MKSRCLLLFVLLCVTSSLFAKTFEPPPIAAVPDEPVQTTWFQFKGSRLPFQTTGTLLKKEYWLTPYVGQKFDKKSKFLRLKVEVGGSNVDEVCCFVPMLFVTDGKETEIPRVEGQQMVDRLFGQSQSVKWDIDLPVALIEDISNAKTVWFTIFGPTRTSIKLTEPQIQMFQKMLGAYKELEPKQGPVPIPAL